MSSDDIDGIASLVYKRASKKRDSPRGVEGDGEEDGSYASDAACV